MHGSEVADYGMRGYVAVWVVAGSMTIEIRTTTLNKQYYNNN